MLRPLFYVTLAFVAMAAFHHAAADEPATAAIEASASTHAEPPLSVFNDKLRRFKFAMGNILASWETAEEFTIRHRGTNGPDIIAVYPDSESNSLFIIGPPDAEQPIRETLGKMIAEQGGSRLVYTQRRLKHERKQLLINIAHVEIELVAVTEKERRATMQERVKVLQEELKVIEKQLNVAERYSQLLSSGDQHPIAEGRVNSQETTSTAAR